MKVVLPVVLDAIGAIVVVGGIVVGAGVACAVVVVVVDIAGIDVARVVVVVVAACIAAVGTITVAAASAFIFLMCVSIARAIASGRLRISAGPNPTELDPPIPLSCSTTICARSIGVTVESTRNRALISRPMASLIANVSDPTFPMDMNTSNGSTTCASWSTTNPKKRRARMTHVRRVVYRDECDSVRGFHLVRASGLHETKKRLSIFSGWFRITHQLSRSFSLYQVLVRLTRHRYRSDRARYFRCLHAVQRAGCQRFLFVSVENATVDHRVSIWIIAWLDFWVVVQIAFAITK